MLSDDYCTSAPCLNGATCNDHLYNFSCSCIEGYTGMICETGRLIICYGKVHSVLVSCCIGPVFGRLEYDGITYTHESYMEMNSLY